MTSEEPRQAHILAVPASGAERSRTEAREAFEARVLYLLDHGVWPVMPVEGRAPAMAPGDGVLLVAVSRDGGELVGSARVAGPLAQLTHDQRKELRVYLQAQEPAVGIPDVVWGAKLTELDVWVQPTNAAHVLARAGVSGPEAARRGVITTSPGVYAAALGRPAIVIPEPAGIVLPTAPPAAIDLLQFVREHWGTVEFDRPLALVGGEGENAVPLPPGLGEALVCRDRDTGHLVVVTVAEAGAGVDVVGRTLRHIGWLQHHAVPAGRRATGLIVAEDPTEDLVYAASAAPNVELAALHLRLRPLSQAPVDAAGAEQRFWRTIEKLSAWCAVHSMEATLAAGELEFDPVAEGSPVWGYVTALAGSVDYRCPWTAGHSVRVAELLVAMAEQLRVGGDVRQYLRLAGLLHDVGNMGVPTQLFDKRTRLSPDEFSVFRRHPELGARIVREVALLSPIAAGIYHHHERLDGRGYPSGLRGEHIPLMARMIGVACCYDAMTSAKPYREAISPETAMDIMRAEAGQHWDSGIVDALGRIIRV